MSPLHEIDIREIGARDAEPLAAFFAANASPATTRHFSPFPLDAETARQIAVQPRRDLFFAAWIGEAIIGLSMLRGWDEGYEIPSFGVVIDERLRGKGWGRRLTAWTLDAARKRGCRRVRLSVNAANGAGVRLYESLGFVRQSETPVVVQGENDVKIVMIKEMTQGERT